MPSSLSVYSEKNGVQSAIITTQFYKIDPNISINLKTKYANQYSAGGDDALIDGIVGTMDFRTGTWQGYFDEDLIATIDLGNKKSFNTISLNFLKDQRSWIFYPTEVICLVSNDNRTFTPVGNYKFGINTPKDDIEIKKIKMEVET